MQIKLEATVAIDEEVRQRLGYDGEHIRNLLTQMLHDRIYRELGQLAGAVKLVSKISKG